MCHRVNPFHLLPISLAAGPLRRRTCSGCTGLTGDFATYQHNSTYVRRRLDDMLCLPLSKRHEYSWLSQVCLPLSQRQCYSLPSQGEDLHHGPLAMACVDPAILRLDFDCVPPDRWHCVINMIDDLTGAVRQQLVDAKLSEVTPPHNAQCDICRSGRTAAYATIYVAYATLADMGACERRYSGICHMVCM